MPYFNDRMPPSCGVGRGLVPLGVAKTSVIKNNTFNNIAWKQVQSLYSFLAKKTLTFGLILYMIQAKTGERINEKNY